MKLKIISQAMRKTCLKHEVRRSWLQIDRGPLLGCPSTLSFCRLLRAQQVFESDGYSGRRGGGLNSGKHLNSTEFKFILELWHNKQMCLLVSLDIMPQTDEIVFQLKFSHKK